MVKKVITEAKFKEMSWKLHAFEQKQLWLRIKRYELMCFLTDHIITKKMIRDKILPFT